MTPGKDMHSRQTCLITALHKRMQDTCHHVRKTKPLCHVFAVGMPIAVMKQSLSSPQKFPWQKSHRKQKPFLAANTVRTTFHSSNNKRAWISKASITFGVYDIHLLCLALSIGNESCKHDESCAKKSITVVCWCCRCFLLFLLALLLQRLDWPLYIYTMCEPWTQQYLIQSDPPSSPSLLCSYLGNAEERMLRPSFRRWLHQLRHVKVLRGVTMNTLLAKGSRWRKSGWAT